MSRRNAVLLVVAAAALPRLAGARGGARHDPRGVRREERHVRAHARRQRHVRVPAGHPVGVHAAAVRVLPRRPLLALRRLVVAVGLAQIAVAVGTALLVLEIGRRLRSTCIGVIAALVATLHPYLVWHDVHVNREILDGFLLALLTLLALLAYERRSAWLAAAAGAVTGLAILGNSRLALLPLVSPRTSPGGSGRACGRWRPARSCSSRRRAVVAPWAIRNRVAGRLLRDHDRRARAVEGEQRAHVRRARPRRLDRRRARAARRAAVARAGRGARPRGGAGGGRVRADALLPRAGDDFWREHPGEKARLAAQAVGMLWRPTITTETAETSRRRRSDVRAQGVRAAVHDPALRAGGLGASSSRRGGSLRWRGCCSPTTR